ARRVAPQELAYRRSETGGIELRYAAKAALAQLLAVQVTADEAEDGAGQRVVHDAVEHVTGQPAVGVVPDLADEVRVWPHRAAAASELAPEGVVVDLGRHVEPPSVRAETQ